MSYPQGPSSGGHTLSESGKRSASSLQFWLKFFGVIYIIQGVLNCLTIIGILFGWLPLLLGWWLFKAGDRLQHFVDTDDVSALEDSIGNARNVGLTMGILTIVMFVMVILMLVLYLIMGAAMLAMVGMAGAAQQ